METTKWNTIVNIVKKKKKEYKHTTAESHQIMKEENERRKEEWNYKTAKRIISKVARKQVTRWQ